MPRRWKRVYRWICLGWMSASLPLAGGPVAGAAPEFGHYPVTSYGMRDFLGHNQVWNVVQDRAGVLYFGNRDRILTFDGESWGRIAVPRGLFVRGLAIDPEGTIWVGAQDELGYLERAPNGELGYVSLREQLPEDERETGICWEVFVHRGGVYFAMNRAVYRWQDGAFTIWHRDSPRMIFVFELAGELYLSQRGSGLYRLAGDDWALFSDAEFFRTFALYSVVLDRDGSWLIPTAAHGLMRYRDGVVEPIPTAADETLVEGSTMKIAWLRDGNLAVSTYQRGLVIFRPDFSVEAIIDRGSGLASTTVKGFIEGREGEIWLALENGVARVERGPYAIIDAREGLETDLISQIVRHEGRLYLACNGGVYEVLPGGPEHPQARARRLPGTEERILALLSHPGGLLFTYRREVKRFFDGRIESVGSQTGGITHELYRSPLDPDRILIGFSEGLAARRWVDGQWIDDGEVPELGENIRTTVQLADGTIWSGTPGRGLFRFTFPRSGEIRLEEATVTRYDTGHGLPENLGWTSPHLTPAGDLYFQTASGLYTYDAATDTFRPYTAFGPWFAAPTTTVSRHTIDPDGTVWASLYDEHIADDLSPWGRGLFGRLLPQPDGTWRWDTLPPSLFAPTTNLYQIYLEERGGRKYLWTGNNQGLIRIDPSRLAPPAAPPAVLIRTVTAGEGHVLRRDGEGGLESLSPKISYEANNVAFTFAAPSFPAGRSILYQSRLREFDRHWSEPSESTRRAYTNLFEGHYHFDVRTVDLAGRSGPTSTVAFVVRPPFYRSGWAYVVYLLGAGLGVYGIVRWRLAALRRRNEELEHTVEERTADLKIARDEADRANRAKSAFLANMSHELRTPLNAIIGFAQVLERDPHLDGRNRQRVSVLAGSGQHLLRLVNEVLDLSKIEAGRMELKPEPVEVATLVRSIAESFEPRFVAAGLRFVVELDPAVPPRLILDAQKIGQVLFNLLGNAAKFTAEGSVHLRLERRGEAVRWRVEDTGPGIPAGEQERIFEPFRQVEGATGSEPGTGLGLAISARLVRVMRGELRLESAPGEGAHFWFDLPIVEPDPAAAGPVASSSRVGYEGPARRLLVVDDIPVNRQVARELLEPVGFAIVEAGDGGEALDRLEAEPADAVLLDLRMAPMDGAEFLRRWREREAREGAPRLPIIAFSASALNLTEAEVRALGADAFVTKPFRLEELLERLGELLGLTWTGAADGSAPASAPPAESASLPPEDLAKLRSLAERGEISALLRELEAMRAEPGAPAVVGDLFALAKSFRLAALRARLDALDQPD